MSEPASAFAGPEAEVSCPECGEAFSGPMAKMWRGRHRRTAHGVEGTGKHAAGKRSSGTRRARAGGTAAGPSRSSSSAGRAGGMAQGISMIWAMLGAGLEMAGVQAYDQQTGRPLDFRQPALAGRVMEVQAPLAGKELDRYLSKHEAVARVLRPILGATELTVLTNVVGPPLLVHLVQTRPEMMPVLRPMMLPMLRTLYAELVKAQREERKVLEAISADPEFEQGFVEFVSMLGFAGPEGEPEPAREPEPAGV